mmetsp:Transcript_17049/g.35034  ORF Transcript_17049/g.35034 Transcript_17049/m.35034 type:complete len:222 (+) Transcript_17049:82-747(+)|eukprot:CAMPEP_0201116506 /NCGR_PEP_ID=MMETSP0850-20130426/762_1 /ASSEMBLY_ACC=CAM_ASM_000622 /TAXON_ID=183588 /ORGANISM="Pseudo-nitzschia fraudulenta, Strain WWA7" /LENGTH=221 /DNA_ID=CAMNT_0047380599 /DNA_START=56 /DNA_END=721 /DNA_ORIENTATION=+
MAPLMKLFMLAITASVAVAFTPSATRVGKAPSSTQLYEDFGLGLGEQTYENQPDLLKGEQEYKQYVNRINEENMLNRKYNVVQRVRELDLLQATVDNGILAKLEKNGLDLATVEKLLPLLEEYGLLSLAANNQQLLVNLAAPLLVEGAPILLPVVAGALEVGPPAFFAAAAALAGVDAALIVNNVEIPFLGLSAGVFLGLLLIPLSVVLAGAGVALGSLKK